MNALACGASALPAKSLNSEASAAVNRDSEVPSHHCGPVSDVLILQQQQITCTLANVTAGNKNRVCLCVLTAISLSCLPDAFSTPPPTLPCVCLFCFSLVSVIRGQVLTGDGTPLIGVNVSFLHYPFYGYTITRQDGM